MMTTLVESYQGVSRPFAVDQKVGGVVNRFRADLNVKGFGRTVSILRFRGLRVKGLLGLLFLRI